MVSVDLKSTRIGLAAAHERDSRLEAEVRSVQIMTIAWMGVELGVALFAGIRARSVSLTGFAGDSAVELLSALVVLARFRIGPAMKRKLPVPTQYYSTCSQLTSCLHPVYRWLLTDYDHCHPLSASDS